jgi:hypothetical protein
VALVLLVRVGVEVLNMNRRGCHYCAWARHGTYGRFGGRVPAGSGSASGWTTRRIEVRAVLVVEMYGVEAKPHI